MKAEFESLCLRKIGIDLSVVGGDGETQRVDVVVLTSPETIDQVLDGLAVPSHWEPRVDCPAWDRAMHHVAVEICMALLKAGEAVVMPLAASGLTLDRLIEDDAAVVFLLSPAGAMVVWLSEEFMNHGACEYCAKAQPKNSN